MAEIQPVVVAWTDEAKPFAMCMSCDGEFLESEITCPKCNLKLLLVHRCPNCSRIAAVRHLRCPYCAQRFVQGNELESPLEPLRPTDSFRTQSDAKRGRRQKVVLLFSLGIFIMVFTLATWLLRYESRQSVNMVLGSSYAPHVIDVRRSPSIQAFSTGKLAAGTVVQITGIRRGDEGVDWFEIRQDNVPGYVRVNEMAPPKGANADGGYQLLRVSFADLNDPSEAGDAMLAAQLYRRLYSSDRRGEELLWTLAGKCRELAARGRSREMMATSRKAYQELASTNGEYASRSLDLLKQIPDMPVQRPTTSSRVPAGSRQADSSFEVIGASNVGPSDQKQTMPHKVMLLNQTRVMVNLLGAQQVQPGQVLLAYVANDVITNNEVAVPAGSVCQVRVTGMNGSGARQGLVALQLQSVQVGDRRYAVDAMVVQLPMSELSLKPGSPVLFRLRRSLVLSR